MTTKAESHAPFTTLEPTFLTLCVYTEFAPFVYEVGGRIVGSDIALLSRFADQYQLGLKISKQAHFDPLWHTPAAVCHHVHCVDGVCGSQGRPQGPRAA